MFKKVFILSASCGMGHVKTAEVLERRFKESGMCESARHIDVLDYTTEPLKSINRELYFKLCAHVPHFVRAYFDKSNDVKHNDGIAMQLDRLCTIPLKRLLLSEQPDLIVCTHFLPARIALRQRGKGDLHAKIITVVTDYDVHALWIAPGTDHYFVGSKKARTTLLVNGVPEDQITVSGIPVGEQFAVAKDKAEMRVKHGLDLALPTVLLTAGGMGHFDMRNTVATLASLNQPLQIICVCGKNEKAKVQLDEAVASLEPARQRRVKVLGFTREMDELMAASDLLVGKPGGLTTSEALARGLVYIVLNPIPGQEEWNTDVLLESGAGIRCNDVRGLPFVLSDLLADPARISEMQSNSRRLGRPNATRDVVAGIGALFAPV